MSPKSAPMPPPCRSPMVPPASGWASNFERFSFGMSAYWLRMERNSCRCKRSNNSYHQSDDAGRPKDSNHRNCKYCKAGANCKWASAHLARDCLLLDKLVHDVIDGLPVIPDVRQRHLIGLIRNLLDLHNRQYNIRISADANDSSAGSLRCRV